MNKQSLMQKALGQQWQQLPASLQAHYDENQAGSNYAEGQMDIDFPRFMQLPLSLFKRMGTLVNRRGKGLETTVEKTMKNGKQYWHRVITYADGERIVFDSLFTYIGNNEFIEYTNKFLGLKMAVFVEGKTLRYESKGYVLKIGSIKIPIPEWLALGHASIKEY